HYLTNVVLHSSSFRIISLRYIFFIFNVIYLLFSLFFFYSSGYHRDLHSFPTRRSSDLPFSSLVSEVTSSAKTCISGLAFFIATRSEEHTSELQSRFDLVCRLLLEKKKTQEYRKTRIT